MNGLIIHYEEYGAQLNMLNAEQLGMLLKSLIQVAQGGDPSSDMDALTMMCFQFMKDRMIRDLELSQKRADARKGKTTSKSNTEQNGTKKNKTEQSETPIPIPITNTNTKEKDICASDSAEAEKLFRKVWELYPLKKGLASVSKTQKQKLFREVGEDHLIRALNRYLEEHKTKELRGDFTPPWKNGSTWFNSGYVDYLDENYQPAPADPQPKKSESGLLNFEQSGTDYDAIADKLWMEEMEGSGDG